MSGQLGLRGRHVRAVRLNQQRLEGHAAAAPADCEIILGTGPRFAELAPDVVIKGLCDEGYVINAGGTGCIPQENVMVHGVVTAIKPFTYTGLAGVLPRGKIDLAVLEQAKRYSKGAFNGPGNWNGFRVPFLFASNGEIIWFLDARDAKPVSRRLSHFHTGPALAAMFT
jgi:hypothetical protein